MKKYKSLTISSLLLMALIVSAPLATYAKDGGKYGDDDYGKNKTEEHADAKVSVNSKSSDNSFFGRFFGGFNFFGKHADAQALSQAEMTPNISGIKAPTVLKVGETGTWSVKASDPQNGSLEYSVDWGDSASNPLVKMFAQPAFVQTSTFTHTYANPGTFTITFTVSNDAGLKTTSKTTVHITGQAKNAPVISNLTATSTRPHSAIIKWSTDVRSNSLVWFGKTSPIDTSGNPNISRNFFRVINHRIVLTKLDPDTTYYLVVGSANKHGTGKSSEISFKTPALPEDNTPIITKLDGPTTIAAGDTETVTVSAYDPKNDTLSYSADWGDNAPSIMKMMTPEPPFVQTSTFSHIYNDAGTYTATFTAENSAGLKASSTITITVTAAAPDTTIPVIAAHDNITVSATSSAGAVVIYTLPDVTDNVDATTTATCAPDSGSTFAIGTTTVLCDHTDSAGNAAVQTSFTITVTADTTGPVISAAASNTGSTSSTISWTTDENATSKVFYSTITPVDLGTSASVSDAMLSTSHSLNVTGLSTSTLYHFVIQSTDASGNITTTSEFTFTTSS